MIGEGTMAMTPDMITQMWDRTRLAVQTAFVLCPFLLTCITGVAPAQSWKHGGRNYKDDYITGIKKVRTYAADTREREMQAAIRTDIVTALWKLQEHENALRYSEATMSFIDNPQNFPHVSAWLKSDIMRTKGYILAELSRYDEARGAATAARKWAAEFRQTSEPKGWGDRVVKEADELTAFIETHQANKRTIDDALRTGADAERRGDLRGALAIYLQTLERCGGEYYVSLPEIWNRAIDNALRVSPPPLIPEQARKHAIFGQTAVKRAKQPSDFASAREEYYSALKLAPWWADVWINLSAVHEELGQYRTAAQDLQFYLRAAPNAPDRATVQSKSYELDYMARQYTK